MVRQGIWVLNPGSSSIKYEWFEAPAAKLPASRDARAVTQTIDIMQLIKSLRPPEVFIVRVVRDKTYPDRSPHGESLTISTPDSLVSCEIVRNNDAQMMLGSVAQSRLLHWT